MTFIKAILSQTLRNLWFSGSSLIFTLLTVTLSVLIFSFFYLIYTNVMGMGSRLGDDLRLIVYLDEEPNSALQEEYHRKIAKFDKVEKIDFVSSVQAYNRFSEQLGEDRDVLTDMPRDFLPPSMEVYPVRSLETLSRIKRFSDYLQTLPGVLKVQYGREWVERFYSFIKLMQIVVGLSGVLLILTTNFMVAHTIRLTLFGRRDELELLRLVGASNLYIRLPFFLEGAFQGLIGSAAGLGALYLLFNWIKLRFDGSNILSMFPFSFFPVSILGIIVVVTTLLCASGSFSSTRKFLRL